MLSLERYVIKILLLMNIKMSTSYCLEFWSGSYFERLYLTLVFKSKAVTTMSVKFK